MPAIKAFYDAMLPRRVRSSPISINFLSTRCRSAKTRLMNLLLSLAEVANAVEIFRQPAVIDGYDSRRTIMVHEEDE